MRKFIKRGQFVQYKAQKALYVVVSTEYPFIYCKRVSNVQTDQVYKLEAKYVEKVRTKRITLSNYIYNQLFDRTCTDLILYWNICTSPLLSGEYKIIDFIQKNGRRYSYLIGKCTYRRLPNKKDGIVVEIIKMLRRAEKI